MSFTIPNQILHYTASSPGYPAHAIRVGNFALSDAGNAPIGDYGEFRGGLNPIAFKTSVDGQPGFEKQTYAVYIHYDDPVDGCRYGPACHLIDDTVITPSSDNQYPGFAPPYDPWYSLVKFTQYIAGSVSGGITSTIGYYGEGLSTTFNANLVGRTLRWYRDQVGNNDPNLYIGGTAGNRIVVNKFYPPIIVNTASRIFDASYVPSVPWCETEQVTGKVYNISGLTHGVIPANEAFIHWDFEGGNINTNGGGDTLFNIPSDNGFLMSGNQQPASWTVNIYVKSTSHQNDYKNFFLWSGVTPINNLGSNPFWGLGLRQNPTSGGTQLTQTINVDGNSRADYELQTATISLDTWYYISVVRTASNYKTYINGKLQHTNNVSPSWNSWVNVSLGTVSVLRHQDNAGINADKYFQFFSYYPVEYSAADIRENFLRYSLNSKIRNGNILLALDTGSKASHTGSTRWTDISGNDLHGVTASFGWQGHKPLYTSENFKITHNSALNNIFLEPFCLSMWVYVKNKSTNSNIFRKGDFTISLFSDVFSFAFINNGTSTLNTSSIENNRWYNIFITGNTPSGSNVYVFHHDGANQVLVTGTLTTGYTPTQNLSDIDVSDANGNIDTASVVFWNSRFSQALCNDWFAIQKGRFGLDSRGNRISQVFVCT
ncbi:hypothetical protein EBU71_01975 [bacterium]|nr:hypothetical protein [Candidatus Elulimicrobium humile]